MRKGIITFACLGLTCCGAEAPGSGDPRHLVGDFFVSIPLGAWDAPRAAEAPGLSHGSDPRLLLVRAVVHEGIARLPDAGDAVLEVNGAVHEDVAVKDDGSTWVFAGSFAPAYIPVSGDSFDIMLRTTNEHAVHKSMPMLDYTSITAPSKGTEISARNALTIVWLATRGDATDSVGLRFSTFGALRMEGPDPATSLAAESGANQVTLPAASIDDWYGRFIASDEATAAGVAAGNPVNVEIMLSRRIRKSNDPELLYGETAVTVELASVGVVLVP